MVVQHIPALPTDPQVHQGRPQHPMADRLAAAAARAGLSLQWQPVPFKRSLADLQRNAAPLCVLGVFDTAERRRFARFSRPLLQEEQQVFLAAQRTAEALRREPSAEAAVMNPQFKLLVFDGVAYGGAWDRWIAARQPPPLRAAAGTSRLPPMLARGHADFTISVVSELKEMRARGDADAAQLEVVQLPGMPTPPQRHLACSLQVPAAWLQALDAALAALPPP